MERGDVGVPQRVVRSDALVGVEEHAALDEVERVGRGGREEVGQAPVAQRADGVDHALRVRRLDRGDVRGARSPGQLQHALELVDRRVPWKDRLPVHHLAEDAPHCPHVHGLRVLGRAHEDLGRCGVAAGAAVGCRVCDRQGVVRGEGVEQAGKYRYAASATLSFRATAIERTHRGTSAWRHSP